MASTSGRGEQERDPFEPLEPPKKKVKPALTAEQFDVFINHRGPDVKTTLAQQLYDSLQKAKIKAYLDAPETELGDYFPSAIKNAIFSAIVHIAILSPRYAESAWCLAELALMFRTKARIIPIFYNVEPSDFRHIKGTVAGAFLKHERDERYPHDIQHWKDCLQNVAAIKCYELKKNNDDLNKLCEEVVSAVVNEKQKKEVTTLQVAKYEVGLHELVQDFYSQCQRNGEMKDKIIGIYGMGGSGKTTLAKHLFNFKGPQFSKTTILFNVREKHREGELTSVQSQLLGDLFPANRESLPSVQHGIAVIKENLERSRELSFLLVIDDVDHKEQLEALLPVHGLTNSLGNSLVIVTTRDEKLLRNAGVKVRYKMKPMSSAPGRELFCWHAFRSPSCKSGFADLVDGFVEACAGLPLALQVMGGHVYGCDKDYWRSQLDVLKTRSDKDIRDKLIISYDALEKDQKEIFMDIACFFTGKRVSKAISMWKASGWRAEYALQTLKDKCLLETTVYAGKESSRNLIQSIFGVGSLRSPDRLENYEPPLYFRMHDHLRDLGREMAENEVDHPRQLWRPEDLIKMDEIKGFQDILKASGGNGFRCYGCLKDCDRMKFLLERSGTSTELRWLKLNRKIPEWVPLQNLHTLKLTGESPWRLWRRDNNQVPLKLRELQCFVRPCLTQSPKDESMRDLNELLRFFGLLKNLETLQLKFESETLEWNIEWNCLLKSVKELTNLKTLELINFQLEDEFSLGNGGKTTDNRFRMESLEAITLCRAYKTWRVSVSGTFCPNLISLKLYTMPDLIEVDVRGVTTLECLVLLKCKELRNVLVDDMLNLTTFQIRICSSLTELPNIGHVSCLKKIIVNYCRILKDVSAIKSLNGLVRIWIEYCPELENIKVIEQLKRLKRIFINECPKLEGEICFQELKRLRSVFIGNCPRLQSIQGIEFLTSLESFVITRCPQLQQVPGFERLEGLKETIITDTLIASCVERLQRLPEQLTIMVGRSAMADKIEEKLTRCTEVRAMRLPREPHTLGKGLSEKADIIAEEVRFKWTPVVSDVIADKFGDKSSPVGDILEMDGNQKMHMVRMMYEFHKTHDSFSKFIFCTTVDRAPQMPRDFCNWSRWPLRVPLGSPAGRQSMIYLCVISEEKFTSYKSWVPLDSCMGKAFLMGVKEEEESKTLRILQSLVARLGAGNTQNYEDPHDFSLERVDAHRADVVFNERPDLADGLSVDPDDFVDEYDDFVDEYDGDSDDD